MCRRRSWSKTWRNLIPSAVAVDLAWLFRCHACSGAERTYTYFHLFSVKYEDEAKEYTSDVCRDCLLQAEEGKTNWSHQALKAYQQQRRTGGTVEFSRGMHGITFELVRTFQHERTRANKLEAKAANDQGGQREKQLGSLSAWVEVGDEKIQEEEAVRLLVRGELQAR